MALCVCLLVCVSFCLWVCLRMHICLGPFLHLLFVCLRARWLSNLFLQLRIMGNKSMLCGLGHQTLSVSFLIIHPDRKRLSNTLAPYCQTRTAAKPWIIFSANVICHAICMELERLEKVASKLQSRYD